MKRSPVLSKSHLSLVLALSGILLFASCKSVNEQIAIQEEAVTDHYQAEAVRIQQLESRELKWEEALKMMKQDNIELKEARLQIIRTKEQRERIFLDLLPLVTLSANVNKALTDLGNINEDDVSFNVFGIISVPGLVSMRTRYYTSTLENIRARWSLELKERELTISLYQSFIRAQGLNLRQANLERSMLWERTPSPSERLNADPEVIARESQLLSIERETDAIQTDLARLLGNNDFIWIPDASSLPELGYVKNPLDIEDIENVGILYRQIQAAELEGTRIREMGIKLQYWPDISFNLSSPPLYSYSGGNSTDWDIDQVIVSANSSLRLDTRLQTYYQLRDVRRQIGLLQERILQNTRNTIQNLLISRKALELCEKQLRLAEVRISAMEDTRRGMNIDELRRQLERVLLLSEQRANLLLQKAQLESVFWLLDESRWERLPIDYVPSEESYAARKTLDDYKKDQ